MGISSETLTFIAVLVPSVILHEVSHGWVALLFGDDTAKQARRLTLNPIRHIDPFGTVLLPAMLAFAGAPVFGYAKPVPVNVRRLRNPRNHSLLVSLAGPATNIVIAVVAGVFLRSVIEARDFRTFDELIGDGVARVLYAAGLINVLLATFNLIPLPPLDGSAVVERVLPRQWWPGYLKLRAYSMGLLLLLVLAVPGGLNFLFEPAAELWFKLL
jgi:Zn-dependent protease